MILDLFTTTILMLVSLSRFVYHPFHVTTVSSTVLILDGNADALPFRLKLGKATFDNGRVRIPTVLLLPTDCLAIGIAPLTNQLGS